MEIIRPGITSEKWIMNLECTGYGNSGFGCKALLSVERDDLRFYTDPELLWRVSKAAVCFKCPCCGEVTDLKRRDWPIGYHKLAPWSREWHNKAPSLS